MDHREGAARAGGVSARDAIHGATALLMGGELRTVDDYQRRAAEIGRVPVTCPIALSVAMAAEAVLIRQSRKLALRSVRL
ncbi:hypothetical protein [Methylobacterium oryzihabitans]|uniref:Uncharacterized protein n=1 Tax=Methylobacterium oryzihabitans TaxID=2499852 RepID=A0A437P5D0_9HYPH|nr:hypothetical protein [Methylobacterium oryzihabitans]RVU17481.1 hypothetical protein EOE48_13925 [Methylobacterium oryzihabitans]